ncbi:MAG: YtxH domain-containing protein [Bacilli bacterium]
MSKKKNGFLKFLTGAAIGTGIGILFAPKKGSETRKELKAKMDEMICDLKEVDIDEVKNKVETKIAKIKAELEELDKEKVLKIAKRKASQIQDMAEELVNYVVEKGTPILEKTANSVREKAIDVTKEVLNKLEKQN